MDPVTPAAPVAAPSAPVAAPAVVAPAPITAPTPAPAAIAPPIAPAIITPEAPITAPVVETVAAPVVAPAPGDTLLGAEPPKAEEPKTEGEKPAEPKAEGAQSDEPAPLPAFDAFKFPEGMPVDTEGLGQLTKDLGEVELRLKTNPAEAHAEMQKLGQNLVERHIAGVQKALERVTEANLAAWEKTKSDWKEAFIKDPELGGNRQDTTVNAARSFISTHGGTPEQQAEFRTLMTTSGLGNHPAMIRMLANAMRAKAEGTSIPAVKPPTQPMSKVAKRYGNKI